LQRRGHPQRTFIDTMATSTKCQYFKDSGVESNFYWYVTFMCAIAFGASIIMPNPKVSGYLQGFWNRNLAGFSSGESASCIRNREAFCGYHP
jgi:hypothetical protein